MAQEMARGKETGIRNRTTEMGITELIQIGIRLRNVGSVTSSKEKVSLKNM